MLSHLHELIGYLGAFLLSFCSIPQIIKTIRTKDVKSFDILYLYMWFFGIVFMLVYVLFSKEILLPLIMNYLINIICVSVLLVYYYKYK
jgi:uncharacterized protein with PQ loop repeat